MSKSVLITGCSPTGIGHALVLAFQSRGLTVFATARDTSKLSSLSNIPNIHILALDVINQASIDAAVEAVSKITGAKLDYLVNNSGRQYCMPLLEADIEEGMKLFDVNFWGVIRMVQAFSPLLLSARGTVVNIGSINAYLHVPFTSIYNASKAAVHMLDSTLRLELSPIGVSVLTVVTGAIMTGINSKSPQPSLPATSHYKQIETEIKKRAAGDDGVSRMKPEEYAKRVVSDVLSGKTGKVFRGTHASTTGLTVYFPVSVVDGILVEGTGLEKKFSKA